MPVLTEWYFSVWGQILRYFANNVLEQSVCQVLSHTGISIELYVLQACHHMKKKDSVILNLDVENRSFDFFLTAKV